MTQKAPLSSSALATPRAARSRDGWRAKGLIACVVRRNGDKLAPLVAEIEAAGGQARAFGVDARDEDQIVALFETIERDVAPLEIVVFNIGANVNFPIRETTARVYRKVWEMACFAGFLTGREAARKMVPRRRGTIIFTGASASLRGRSGFAAFSSAKHALARARPMHGEGTWPGRRPCRPCRDRRRDRYALDPREFSRSRRA